MNQVNFARVWHISAHYLPSCPPRSSGSRGRRLACLNHAIRDKGSRNEHQFANRGIHIVISHEEEIRIRVLMNSSDHCLVFTINYSVRNPLFLCLEFKYTTTVLTNVLPSGCTIRPIPHHAVSTRWALRILRDPRFCNHSGLLRIAAVWFSRVRIHIQLHRSCILLKNGGRRPFHRPPPQRFDYFSISSITKHSMTSCSLMSL